MTKRIAIVVSHPIQHFCPQYSSWATIDGIEIKVFFASRHGLDPYVDKNFGRTVKWDDLILDFPHEFLPGALERPAGANIDCHQLPDRLKEFSPDILVVYGHSQPLQRRAAEWASAAKKQLIMIADSELRARRSWWKLLAKSIVMPRLLKKFDVFLSVGDANESYYRSYGVDDYKLVRCSFPIDIKSFNAVNTNRVEVGVRLRTELGIPPEHIIILMVGKLVEWKRQQDLVKFSNLVQATRRDITVILAGSGSDEQVLRGMAQNTSPSGVIFAGFLTPSKLVEYYAAADIYVHCSEVEPHSLAISEAIYSGLPVVLSNRCGSYGPSDDVRAGLNGFVYECGNVEEMSAALMEIIDRPELRQSMGRASKEIADANQALAHGQALLQALEVLKLRSGH